MLFHALWRPRSKPRGLRTASFGIAALVASLVALAGAAEVARAQTPPKREEVPPKQEERRLKWKYPRFRPSQYIVSLLVSGAGLYIERGTRGLPDNNLHGTLLLDTPSRNLLVAKTPEGRKTAASVSDIFWHTTQYFPVADSLLTPLLTDRGNIDTALQMTLINWQVQTTSFVLTRISHRTIGRRRPLMAGCDEDVGWHPFCKAPSRHQNGSFLSGHTSMAFAGATAACSHHFAFPMYGGNAADVITCGTLLTSASVVGILRVASDNHWWSDVIAGAMLGTAVGFGIPFFLHYGAGSEGGLAGVFGQRVALLPLGAPGALGLSITSIQ
jgi:membrane-associated phospholipid phosphatase